MYIEMFPENINRRNKFKNRPESNENHTKWLTPRTSTNPLIQNMFPELCQKKKGCFRKRNEQSLNLGKHLEMKSKNHLERPINLSSDLLTK